MTSQSTVVSNGSVVIDHKGTFHRYVCELSKDDTSPHPILFGKKTMHCHISCRMRDLSSLNFYSHPP
jgi:hypothetical protein